MTMPVKKALFLACCITLVAVTILFGNQSAKAVQDQDTTPTPVPAGASVTISDPIAYRTPQGNLAITSVTALKQASAGKALYDPGVSITGDAGRGQSYQNLRWSPDGTKLLFTDTKTNSVFVEISGQKPVQVAPNLGSNFPAAWSPDGTEIAIVARTNQSSADGNGTLYQIQLVTLNGNTFGQPQFGASFLMNESCGTGGASDPALVLYNLETGSGGYNFSLDWTTVGFLHSMDCTGRGIAFTSLGNQNADWTDSRISRVAVSPDGTKAVGVVTAQGGDPNLQVGLLATINLLNGNLSQVASDTAVDRVAWSPDGKSLVYTTRAAGAGFPLTAKAPADAQGMFGDPRGYTCAVWRIALGSPNAKPIELFHTDDKSTYALGLLSITSDQSAIAVTLIPSDADLVNALNQGAPLNVASSHAPFAGIVVLPWDSPAKSVSTGLLGGQPAISKGPFTAVAAQVQQPPAGGNPSNNPSLAPTGNSNNAQNSANVQPTTAEQSGQGGPSSGLNPAALSVGAKATVTVVTGGTLNMHPSPSSSAPIVHTLNPGDVVTVLSPPQLAEGYRWWLVRAPDNSQGWAVDQIGSTVTLTLISVIDTGNCLGHVGGTLHVGGTAMSKDHESLFSTPGDLSTQNVVGTVEACDKLDIVGGPQLINGINWWQVRTAQGVVGWAYERPLYAPGGPYLIIPID